MSRCPVRRVRDKSGYEIGKFFADFASFPSDPAHNLLSKIANFSHFTPIESKGPSFVANGALSNIGKGLGLPLTRLDARDSGSRQVWELKPVTHKNRPDMRAADQKQVHGYVDALNRAGEAYFAGEPTDLAPDVPGGTYIGSFDSMDGTTYGVSIYPGEDQGMIYYSLNPEKTPGEKVGDFLQELGEGLAKSGPGNWMNQGPLVRPLDMKSANFSPIFPDPQRPSSQSSQ